MVHSEVQRMTKAWTGRRCRFLDFEVHLVSRVVFFSWVAGVVWGSFLSSLWSRTRRAWHQNHRSELAPNKSRHLHLLRRNPHHVLEFFLQQWKTDLLIFAFFTAPVHAGNDIYLLEIFFTKTVWLPNTCNFACKSRFLDILETA